MGFMNRMTGVTSETSAKKALFDLQVEQHQHDEKYHREIARLSLHHRLNHMALHFAKYAGKIAGANDPIELQDVFVDVLVIALSTANVLNLDLGELLQMDNREFSGLLELGLAAAERNSSNEVSLLNQFTVATGRIAGACEKIDHLEEINFRAEIRGGVARLAELAIGYIASRGADPAEAVRNRLTGVKRRLKLHGRI